MSDRTGRSFEDRVSRVRREFLDPLEEKGYIADAWMSYGPRMRAAAVFAGGLAALGTIGQILGLTDPGHLFTYIATHIALFLALAAIFWQSFRPKPGLWIPRSVFFGITAGALAWVLPHTIALGEPNGHGPGTLMAALTLFVMLPVRFWYTIISGGVIVLAIVVELFLAPQTGPNIEFSATMIVITLISARTVFQAKLASRFRFFARQELDTALQDLRLKELEVEEQASRLRDFIMVMDQGIAVIDKDYRFIAWNSRFEALFALPAGFINTGLPFDACTQYLRSVGYFGQRDVDERRQRSIDRPQPGEHFELPLPGGRYLDIRRAGLPDGSIVTTYTDITERKRAENLTRLLGMQDPLTHLANRALFLENLLAAIGEGARHNFQVGLMMIDLDHFKPVNDTHGHPVGDAVLKKVAEILTTAVRDLDTVARLGGDEFAVILTNLSWPEQADLPARRILAALQAPMDIDGRRIQIGGSIGIAFFPDHGTSPDALIARADEALYAAKAAGRNCIRRAGEGMARREPPLPELPIKPLSDLDVG